MGSLSLLQGIFPIKPGSPALQADSLPTELSGKPNEKESALIVHNNIGELHGYNIEGKKPDVRVHTLGYIYMKFKNRQWDLPGGSVANAPCSLCRQPGFSSWSGK